MENIIYDAAFRSLADCDSATKNMIEATIENIDSVTMQLAERASREVDEPLRNKVLAIVDPQLRDSLMFCAGFFERPVLITKDQYEEHYLYAANSAIAADNQLDFIGFHQVNRSISRL